MTASDIPPQRFRQLFAGKTHVYNTVEFTELNREKAEGVSYLVFEDTKVRGGLILGRRGNLLCSPFSSPYGGLVTDNNRRVWTVEQMWRAFAGYAESRNCGFRVVLPPLFMGNGVITKSVSALNGMECGLTIDVNHHFELGCREIEHAFSVKTRNQLHQAQKLQYTFEELTPTPANIARVYDVIVRNHASRGFPVNMALESVVNTAPVVNAQFFVLALSGTDVAAAQIHNPVPGVAQVIYWGDVPGYASCRPMNMLAYRLFSLYQSRGYRIVDIGISSVDGEPNYGLCRFKEGLGCEPTSRFSFRKSPVS